MPETIAYMKNLTELLEKRGSLSKESLELLMHLMKINNAIE